MTYSPKRPPLDPCPIEEVFIVVGGKWKARVLLFLYGGPCALAALRAHLPRAASPVLLKQLAALEVDGLVESRPIPRGQAQVREYRLSADGAALVDHLALLLPWALARLRARGEDWTPPALGPDRPKLDRPEA